MLTTTMLCAVLAASQPAAPDGLRLDVTLDPETHGADVAAVFVLARGGDLVFELAAAATIDGVEVAGRAGEAVRVEAGGDVVTYRVERRADERTVRITYHASFEQDIAAGEQPGEIHNKSVTAFVGPEGVFLSDGSAWHPRPVNRDGHAIPLVATVDITPLDGWVFVASGDPVAHRRRLEDPVWNWAMPRPVDGVAISGNRHEVIGRVHATEHGPVEVVMHVSAAQAEKAEMFLTAAAAYLDLYVPRLGAFPYERFTIVENFFSSGFAYPGFTLLGPRVVGMAPRSLAPGYLDHELVHNWWGNGVYVDPDDGNWCEALTSFCANYGRRVIEQGPEAGLAHRRGILMKLSADPETHDDGPLGDFGRPGGPGRFVGYDKGSFVFAMLADVIDDAGRSTGETMWTCLRRFAESNLGRPAGWAELQASFEAADPARPSGWLDGFFDLWVRRQTVPRTLPARGDDVVSAFAAQYEPARLQDITMVFAPGATSVEIDPEFRLYRVLPPAQIIPTLAGTQGRGGLRIAAGPSRSEVASYLARHETDADGENLLVIGRAAFDEHRSLLRRAADPIDARGDGFTLGGETWDGADHALLHTMQHPDRPGRFITVFLANGDAGWSRLRLIDFYTRDTTIVWDGGAVVARRTYEPDRRIPLAAGHD